MVRRSKLSSNRCRCRCISTLSRRRKHQCAREQGKFWEYHDRLFSTRDLSVAALAQTASEVGLKENEFRQCLASDTSRTSVEEDVAEAERLGVSGTPTFLVNGKLFEGAASFAALSKQIDQELVRLDHLRGRGILGEDLNSAAAPRESRAGAPAADTMRSNEQPVNAVVSQSQCPAFVPPPVPNCPAAAGAATDVLSLLPASPSTGINCPVQFTAVFTSGQGAAQQQCNTMQQIEQWVGIVNLSEDPANWLPFVAPQKGIVHNMK